MNNALTVYQIEWYHVVMKKKLFEFARTYIPYASYVQGPEPILGMADFKLLFDERLKLFFDKKIITLSCLTKDTFILALIEHVRQLTLTGGKRSRPYLAYLAYSSEGGMSVREIIDILVGLELFHVFALVHDDIIDKAPRRHGVDTLHNHVSSLYALPDDHYAHSQAILAGDLLFSFAKEAIDISTPAKARPDINKLFYQMVDEVVIGQMLDVAMTKKESVTSEQLREKTELKSARYSFVQPMRIGAALAGNEAASTEFYKKFGYALGMAFQIQDDMLDIVGDTKYTGKTNMLDVESGQHTYFTQYIFDKGTVPQKDTLKKHFGKNITQDDKNKLSILFYESGAIAEGKKAIADFFNDALGMVEKAKWNDVYKKTWHAFITLMNKRIS